MELYGLTQKGQHLDFELSQIGGTYETDDLDFTQVEVCCDDCGEYFVTDATQANVEDGFVFCECVHCGETAEHRITD